MNVRIGWHCNVLCVCLGVFRLGGMLLLLLAAAAKAEAEPFIERR